MIVESDPYFIMIQDKVLGLFPWGFNPNEDLNKYKSYQVCDYRIWTF